MKNRIINFYIFREIASLFFLGISIFTMILLMGRLIKLTEMVLTRGVPFLDVVKMILYLMPSFLVFTIPMAFLLAVLLAFGRLSADNEITVLKACGISLIRLLPPVLICAFMATALGICASTIAVPAGNNAFKQMTVSLVSSNVAATLREKVFWDDIPGLVLYCDRYDEEQQTLKGVIIHDGRDAGRPLTIFASSGRLQAREGASALTLALTQGSIHSGTTADEYRLINFGEYAMTVATKTGESGGKISEIDMTVDQLLSQSSLIATSEPQRRKLLAELHSRFALPCAAIVFAVVGVPMGIQNRRSGKSAGFSISIALLLLYYILFSLLRTLVEKGTIPPLIGMWSPNILFLSIGGYLLWMASHERRINIYAPFDFLKTWRKS